MFKSKNFCHIASNNRNQVKVGVFTYRTTDNLATVSASGYFNERIIDINLHDIIVHEEIDSTDNTKVKYNFLCVTERTLENVGTIVLKSDWQGTIEQAIADLQTYIDNNFVKLDGTSVMTGPLLMRATADFKCAVAPYWDGIGFFKLNDNNSVTLMASIEYNSGFEPAENNVYNIGSTSKKWKNLYLSGKAYMSVINNGYDIAVPVTNSADTMALKSQVDDAANSGEQLYTTGVWYAKMYAATTVPTGAEYDGRNYADFSQVDSDNNPVIKIYTGASGAWTLTQTITPPANHNGYITVTSKIWDIVEQSGQQGGQVLWSHNTKTFTPYPRIISFENAALTGVPTAPLADALSPNNQIATKEYVDDLVSNSGTGRNVGDIFLTMRNDNELNGAVECDGSTYNTTDFTGAQSIDNLLADGKVPYVSMAVYASTVATQGWCDKFGWDGTGNVQFKVPTLSAYIWQKLQTGVIGNGSRIGLQDANNNDRSLYGWSSGANYPFVGNVDYNAGSLGGSADGILKVSNDPTKSGIIAGSASDISQQRCMVQLTISATDEAVATCTAVTAQVAANTAAIAGADYVVESQLPTAQNNYTWYRKYKSGWVEQGGQMTGVGSSYTTKTIPVEMADTNYTLITSTSSSFTGNNYAVSNPVSETTFQVKYSGTGSTNVCWQVSGIAA